MDIKNIVKTLGFDSLNPMQESMLAAKGANRMLLAPTGAGKTLAYLFPTVERLEEAAKGVQVIIISPSRELASQIDTVFRSMKSNFSISCVYGSHSQRIEKRSLEALPTVIVGTPGRLLDHLSRNQIDGTTVQQVVFDEFDKLLEMGFSEEMGQIISHLPNIKYSCLTSATKPLEAPEYINLTNFEIIDFLTGEASGELTIKKIGCDREARLDTVVELLRQIGDEQSMIFCNFRDQAEEVSNHLYNLHIDSEYFHGGMEQFDRERSLIKFRNGSVNILVSTDLAARGLDIPTVKHVIHYELPTDHRAFVHRNGRTARVTDTGTAYLLLTRSSYKSEKGRFDWIEDTPGEVITLTPTTAKVAQSKWTTVYISKGKKDKLSKIDIVGFLCQKGGITKDAIGIIELKDNHSFVAVKRTVAKDLLKKIQDQKIKNMKAKINMSF